MTSVSAPISLKAKGLSTLKIVAYQINAPLDGAIGGLAPPWAAPLPSLHSEKWRRNEGTGSERLGGMGRGGAGAPPIIK